MPNDIPIVLRSDLFRDSERLQRAASDHRHHLTLGDEGEHVRRLHVFITFESSASFLASIGAYPEVNGYRSEEEARAFWDQYQTETFGALYGPRTADLVRMFKSRHDIVDRSRQSRADGIVGVRTIREMDRWALIPRSRGGLAERQASASTASHAMKPLLMAGPVVAARMLRT